MKIATAPSRNSKRWRTVDVSWDWMLDKLRHPVRTGETVAEWGRMSREEKASRKDVGGFVGGALEGGRRVNGAVKERWLLTLDADDAGPNDWDDVSSLYDWRMCVYSTHSHTPQKPRLRWIIPLKRAVSPEEYQAIARKMAEIIGIETMDPTTYQPERLMYWPSCSTDAEYVFSEQDGPILRPEELLGMYGDGDAWRDVSLWPLGAREKEVVVREAKRQGDPESKPGIVGRFCRAFDVPSAIDRWLSDVYEECDVGGRYTYTKGSSAGGAVLYDNGKFLYSHHSTDPAGGQLLNSFDLVRVHLFGSQDEGKTTDDVTRLPSYVAMCAMAAEDPECKQAFFAERMAEMQAEFADLLPEQEATGAGAVAESASTLKENPGKSEDLADSPSKNVGDAGEGEVDMSWLAELEVNKKTGEADSTFTNARLILEHDPRLAGKVGTNQFSSFPTVRGSLPWRPGAKDGELWSDTDEAYLLQYMEAVWKFRGKDKIEAALKIVMEQNSYHPVREYLEGLTWDGKERLDTLLVRYMGAEDSAYVRAVTRKWMCGAVKRAFLPGCKFDSLLVFVGPQGIGKSRFGMILSRGWFTDSLTRMDGKEAYEAIRGVWIVELSELAAARKSEQEAQKQFLSAQWDRYRPAFGKNVVEYKRQCVFYATTNDPEPLRDNTGARRYWPVACAGVNQGQHIGLEEEVDQLWAEAVVRYKAGESLWLDDSMLAEAAQIAQETYSERDEWIGLIQEYLDTPITPDWEQKTPEERRAWIRGDSLEQWDELDLVRRETVSGTEIRVECFGEDRAGIRGNDFSGRRIAKIMGLMPGWTKMKTTLRVPGYGQQRCYARENSAALHQDRLKEEHKRW